MLIRHLHAIDVRVRELALKIKLTEQQSVLLLLAIFFIIQYPGVLVGRVLAPADLALYHPPWDTLRPVHYPVHSYVLSDIMDYVLPQSQWLRNAILRWDIPYFTDSVQNGIPWLLVSRHENINPIFLICTLFFGSIAGYSAAIFVKFMLGGFFFHQLLKYWGVGRLPAAVGSLIFVGSSYAVQNMSLMLNSMYFLLPVALYGLQRLLDGSKVWICITPITFFSIFFSGYPPAVAYHATLYIAFVIFWLITTQQSRIRGLISLSVCGIMTFLLIGPGLIETYRYLYASLDFAYRANYWAQHLPRHSIVSLFVPWGFAERTPGVFVWVRHAIYIGIFPLLLAILSLCWGGKRKEFYFFFLFFVYLCLVLFSYTFLATVYRYIPVLNGTMPNNQIMIMVFVGAVLATFGIEQWWDSTSIWQITFPFAGFLAVMAYLFWSYGDVLATAKPSRIVLAAIMITLSTGLIAARYQCSVKQPWLGGIVILFVAVDLIVTGFNFNRTVARSLVYPRTPAVTFVQRHIGDSKMFMLGTAFLADTPRWYSIRTVGGRGFFTRETKNLYRLISEVAVKSHPTQILFNVETTRLASSLLDVLSVRYVAAPLDFAQPPKRTMVENLVPGKFRLVHSGDVALFENTHARDRAFLVPDVAVASSEEIYRNMQAENRDLRYFGWIDETTIDPAGYKLIAGQNGTELKGELLEKRIFESSQSYLVRTNRTALLVVGDNYYPGWSVQVNGAPATLLKVDYALRGVVLPAGESRVEFSYFPPYLKYGLPIAMLSFFALIFGVATYWRHEQILSSEPA